ncbi:hypothetical protein ACROYT_G035628, partial [Oculina patagonica]
YGGEFYRSPVSKDKQGRFRKKKTLNRSKSVSNVLKNKWSAYRSFNSEVIEEESDFSDAFSLPGRRVLELGVLAKSLDEGCKACKTPLRLSDCTDETISGLGSFLYIVCQNTECGEINQCTTNKAHRVAGNTRGRKIFYVNTKLAAGMLDAGMGATHVNALLSSINVPVMRDATLKAREREVGPVIETVAKTSCLAGLEAEKKQWDTEGKDQDCKERHMTWVGRRGAKATIVWYYVYFLCQLR